MTLPVLLSAVVFVVGIAVVIYSVEEFVEHVADAAVGLGVSTFLLTVVLAGTDLENAILGGAAVLGDLPNVGLGTVFGEALFGLCGAIGLAGVFVPFEIETPSRYLGLVLVSPLPLLAFVADATLSRIEGVVLVVLFVPLLWLVYRWEQSQDTRYLEPEDEIGEESDEPAVEANGDSGGSDDSDGATGGDGTTASPNAVGTRETAKRVGIVFAAIAGMTIGSELAVEGARGLLAVSGIAELAFGATVMSLIASLEELFLTVEPVREGRPEVASGNVVGSMLFFVTANAGVLAVIQPLTIDPAVFTVQLPFFLGALVLVLAVLYRGRVTRPVGVLLLVGYGGYWAANYL